MAGMCLDFYQLQEQPFGFTPDPRYLYLGASHGEALASLSCGINTGCGHLVLIAPPGMGKTTLLFRLLEDLRRSPRTVFLFQTQWHSSGLVWYLVTDLGIETRELDFVNMHEQLNQLLLREKSAGRHVVLFIDEAQNLDNSVLETARLLSGPETPSEELLQIVLAGQEQLGEKLKKPDLAALRQRIAIVARLEPLNVPEVIEYIATHLMVAGYRGGGLFTPAALNRIAESTRGIPRYINNLCFNTMLLGRALCRERIGIDLVDQAAADLDISSVAVKSRRELPAAVRPAPAKPKAPVRVPAPAVSIFRAAERKPRFRSAVVLTPVVVLAILTALLYRQDIRIAAAQTRRTLVVAAASLSWRHTAEKADPNTTIAWKQASGKKPLAQPGRDPAVAKAAPAATNSTLAAPAGASDVAVDEQRARIAAAPRKQPMFLQGEFAGAPTVVVVRPQDDLRQICLRYLGSYSAQLASKVSKLNPELTNPDRIVVGQRIVLPRSANVGANVSRNSSSRP
jgi:general secretion pathway protein A